MVDTVEIPGAVSNQLLQGKEDRYGGFIVDTRSLPDAHHVFCDVLRNSLEVCLVVFVRGKIAPQVMC